MISNFSPELESKRIENAQNRKLVWALLGTTLVAWILLILNRIHPNPATRWILLAILLPAGYCLYRLAQKARKIQSVLPPDMESRRIRIAKDHNRLCMVLLLATGVFLIGTIWIGGAITHGHDQPILWITLLIAALIAGSGIRYIIQRDNALCRRLGYMCPICHRPLYEAHAATYLSGLCPKCKQSVLS